MSDSRWDDVLLSARWAAHHFKGASRILDLADFDIREQQGYTNAMAFFHAMQLGHTAFEESLHRVLLILNEERPAGERWHAELIQPCAVPAEGRPAIISQELAMAAHQTRAFRHRAAHTTVQFEFVFDKERARVAASAGARISAELEPSIQRLIEILDE